MEMIIIIEIQRSLSETIGMITYLVGVPKQVNDYFVMGGSCYIIWSQVGLLGSEITQGIFTIELLYNGPPCVVEDILQKFGIQWLIWIEDGIRCYTIGCYEDRQNQHKNEEVTNLQRHIRLFRLTHVTDYILTSIQAFIHTYMHTYTHRCTHSIHTLQDLRYSNVTVTAVLGIHLYSAFQINNQIIICAYRIFRL